MLYSKDGEIVSQSALRVALMNTPDAGARMEVCGRFLQTHKYAQLGSRALAGIAHWDPAQAMACIDRFPGRLGCVERSAAVFGMIDDWTRDAPEDALEFIMGLPEDQDRHGLLAQWDRRVLNDRPALVLKVLDLEAFETCRENVRPQLLVEACLMANAIYLWPLTVKEADVPTPEEMLSSLETAVAESGFPAELKQRFMTAIKAESRN